MTDVTRSRIYLTIIVLLLVVVGTMAWKFIVAGSTRPGDERRTVVVLEPAERTLMLREMRGFVAGVQRIADGLARDDMKAVAKASRDLGAARADDAPVAMLGKLPLEFKKLAFATHGGFDAIAAQADAGGTAKQALAQLSGVLGNCVACHDRYQVSDAAAK